MSPDAFDTEIQDYLDGRMAEPQRRAFEARVAADAALARRVRTLREIGAALAGGDERLSPDFYVRLRSRFEQSQTARAQPPRGRRWEALGLAAAALIALVLLVPEMLKDRSLERMAVRREAPASPAPPRSRVYEPMADAAPENEAPPKQEVRQQAVEGKDKSKKEAEREPAPSLPDERESQDRAPSAVPERDSRLDEAAPAPAPRAAASSEGFAVAAPPSGFRVRPGLVEREAVVEIDDRARWEQLELAELGRYDPARRVVLVGDRDRGLDCAASQLVTLADTHEIRLAAQARGTEQDGHGCAFVVPRDGRSVRVIGP